MTRQIDNKVENVSGVNQNFTSLDTPVTPVEKSNVPLLQSQKIVNIILLGLLFVALLVTAIGVSKSMQQRIKAAVDPIIGHVNIDPGIIITKTDAPAVQLSTLAYDKDNNPVWSNVWYKWGMSSTDSVGTLILNPGNNKIATFKGLHKGIGDIFVTATNVNGNGFGSIQVFVDVTPTPTPLPSPTSVPTPTPEPGAILNGSFEMGTDVPDNWSRTNKSGSRDFRTDALSYTGDFSFKFLGEIDKIKGLTQSINNTWKSGTKLFIGGWLKTLKLNKRGISQITVTADYSDKTREKFILAFPTGQSFDWTYRLGSFTLAKTAITLHVKIEYSKQNGEGYFDAITLSSNQPAKAKAIVLQSQKVAPGEIEE